MRLRISLRTALLTTSVFCVALVLGVRHLDRTNVRRVVAYRRINDCMAEAAWTTHWRQRDRLEYLCVMPLMSYGPFYTEGRGVDFHPKDAVAYFHLASPQHAAIACDPDELSKIDRQQFQTLEETSLWRNSLLPALDRPWRSYYGMAFPESLWSCAAKGIEPTITVENRSVPRFRDRGEYVEDLLTGLLWQKDGEAGGEVTLEQAWAQAPEARLGGLSNWRLPTGDELYRIHPAATPPFVNTSFTSNTGNVKGDEGAAYWFCRHGEFPAIDETCMAIWQRPYHCAGSRNHGRTTAYVRYVHDPLRPRLDTPSSSQESR